MNFVEGDVEIPDSDYQKCDYCKRLTIHFEGNCKHSVVHKGQKKSLSLKEKEQVVDFLQKLPKNS